MKHMRTSIIYLFYTTYTLWVFYLAVMNLATANGRFFSTIIGSGMLFFSNLTVAEVVGLLMAAVAPHSCELGVFLVAVLGISIQTPQQYLQ